ncbi:Unstructured region C-term to UIM in Ataxin3 [Microdochium nivale]|nr:Unstructured region C-term to UIM in Ataxin3 [Microdochium nivale]
MPLAKGETYNMSVADLMPAFAEAAKGSKFCIWGNGGCANLRPADAFIPSSPKCSYCRNGRSASNHPLAKDSASMAFIKLRTGYPVPEGSDLIFCCHPNHPVSSDNDGNNSRNRAVPSRNFRPREPYPCEDHRCGYAWRIRRDIVCDACKGNRDPLTSRLVKGGAIAAVSFAPTDYFALSRSKKLDWWYFAFRRVALWRDPRLTTSGGGGGGDKFDMVGCGVVGGDVPMATDINSEFSQTLGFIKTESPRSEDDVAVDRKISEILGVEMDMAMDIDVPELATITTFTNHVINTQQQQQKQQKQQQQQPETLKLEIPSTLGFVDYANPIWAMTEAEFAAMDKTLPELDAGEIDWDGTITPSALENMDFYSSDNWITGTLPHGYPPFILATTTTTTTTNPPAVNLAPTAREFVESAAPSQKQQQEQEQIPPCLPTRRLNAPARVRRVMEQLVGGERYSKNEEGLVLRCPGCGDVGRAEMLFRGFALNEPELALRPDWALCLRCNEPQPASGGKMAV